MAVSPSVFRVNHGETKIAPVHVLDVATALNTMLTANSAIGQTYALPGPRTYTFEEIMTLVEALTLTKLKGPNFPKPMLKLAARIWDLIWWPTVSPDEVTRRYINDAEVAEGMKGFADLGIEPDLLEHVAITYLRRYRSASYFDVSFLSSFGRTGRVEMARAGTERGLYGVRHSLEESRS
jgi:NADH dehydrogenase (ubiquinone) 1 alpha subcomplex subunit 9